MPSITSWMRLEPRSRRDAIDAGLEARVYDPLWLLARQWQLNEFKAEDAGSPVAVHLDGAAYQLTRVFAGDLPADGKAAGVPLTLAAPLEATVQREVYTRAANLDVRFAADAGRYFVRELEAFGVSRYAAGYLKLYPIDAPTGLDADGSRFAAAIAGRAIDGSKLFKALRAGNAETPAIAAADQPLVDSATQSWRQWYASVVSDPAAPQAAWVPNRMEYSFAVAAPTPSGEVVLEAQDYRGGGLEWYAFRGRAGATLGAPPAEAKQESLTRTVIPSPVRYPGMPSDRWWEFEDAQVDFGAIDTLPGDPAALVLLQFAITYGNDWFLVPVPVRIGSLCKITSVSVTDSFGGTFAIPSFSRTSGAADSWRMFTIAGATDDLLFVPPGTGRIGAPRLIEQVLLARDEMANMAWAIEKKVLDASGRVFQRTRPPIAPDERGTAALSYALVTAVPENWIPLVPVAESATGRIHLRRAAMAVTGAPPPHAQGAILGAPGPLIVADEEIPRSGVTLTRAMHYARWIDGSTCLWIGRLKEAGQGEANSGLQFDTARKGTGAP
jgi:hypothetical protein